MHVSNLRRVAALLSAFVLILTTVGGASPAAAQGGGPGGGAGGGGGGSPQRVLADGLFGPLSVAVGGRGHLFVAQQNLDPEGQPDLVNTISRVSRFGRVTDVVSEPGIVAVDRFRARTYYTAAPDASTSELRVRNRRGATRVVADLLAHETTQNPDGATTYGFVDADDECETQWLAAEEEQGLPPFTYTGIVESNPYAIAATARGVYVADAAANSILFVRWNGAIRTVAVLPPQSLTIPAGLAENVGAPACAGLEYAFEPVPTDVEILGRHLYVSLLPGGPEDPSLGARGAVYEIDRFRGDTRRIADGFVGATDLAIARNGTLYVAELFGGQVTRVTPRGVTSVAVRVPNPAAVEIARGRLYVAYDVFGPDAKIGRFRR